MEKRTESQCPECGAMFHCSVVSGGTTCWCFSYPPISPAEGSTCLCEECLRKEITKDSLRNADNL